MATALQPHEHSKKPVKMDPTLIIDLSADEVPSDEELSEKEVDNQDGEYIDEGKKRKARPKKPKTKSNKRTKPTPLRTNIHFVFRQPAVRMEPDIQNNTIWRACVDKVTGVIDRESASATRDLARIQLSKLQEDPSSFDWGIAEGQGGPCERCVKDGKECVVKVTKSIDGSPGEITARCIRCGVNRFKCDLKGPGIPRRVIEAPALAIPPANKGPSQPAAGPGPSLRLVADIAPPQPVPDVLEVRASSTVPKVPDEAAIAVAVPLDPKPIDARILAAINDLREFSQHMHAKLVERGDLHFGAKMLLEDAEEQIVIIEQYIMPDSHNGPAKSSDEAFTAMRQIHNFADDLQEMEPEGGRYANMMAIMFKKLKGRIEVLQKVISDLE